MNDTTTLAQQMVAAASAATRTINLSMDPTWVAVIKVRDTMLLITQKFVESEGL